MPPRKFCALCPSELPPDSAGDLCPDCAVTLDELRKTSRVVPENVPSASAPTVPECATSSTETGGRSPAVRGLLPTAPPGYELVDRLGAGGMGAVFLAREHAADRLVAMKFLHHAGDPDAVDRFLVEVRALARLDHPNIVRVLATDFLRADPYFTTEHVPGGSLARVLQRRGRLPAAEAVRIVRAVADGLGAAHAERIIHRDVKPSNILLAADGTPKVADFGLAKRLDEVDPVTLASGALGTPAYMPSEQISRKNGDVGPWSDVYGLGATLYHLLTGCPPFDGASPEEIVIKVLADPLRLLRAVCPDVPKELEGIVVKCLEKDPADRYQTMAELAADLDRYTAGQQPRAPVLTRWRRTKRWAFRNRHGLGAVGAVLLVVVAAFVLGRMWGLDRAVVEYVRGPKKTPLVVSDIPPVPAFMPVNAELTHVDVTRELRAGNPVTLIGAKGLRVVPAWGMGPCWTRGLADGADVPFAIRCKESSILQLLPDPGVDRYRVRMSIRQDRRDEPTAQKPVAGISQVGVAVGHRRLEPNDTTVHAFVAVGFNECAGGSTDGRRVECTGFGFVDYPQQSRTRGSHLLGHIPLAPAGDAPWRELEIDVTPDGITYRHSGFSYRCGAHVLDPHLCRLERQLGSLAGVGDGLQLGTWTPRAPVGIWVENSWASVRSFVIEPLP